MILSSDEVQDIREFIFDELDKLAEDKRECDQWLRLGIIRQFTAGIEKRLRWNGDLGGKLKEQSNGPPTR